ncbi:TPA: hypothetical protein ACGOR8_001931 [Streptococcus suis]
MKQLEQVSKLRQQFEELQNDSKDDMLFMAFVSFELGIELTEDNLHKLSNMYSIYMIEDHYTGMLSEQLRELAEEVGI